MTQANGDALDENKPITLDLRVDRVAGSARFPWVVFALALTVGGASAALPLPAWVRAGMAALACVALGATQLRRRQTARPISSLVVDARGIWRERAGEAASCVAGWEERFGVVVLCDASLRKGLFAFSSPQRTRLVAASFDAHPADRWVAPGATVCTDFELDAALANAQGALSGASAATLTAALEARAAHALGRICLVDPDGAEVSLDGTELRARGLRFDLDDPLEWKRFVFQESGRATADDPTAEGIVYRALWVSQGAAEAVLVCPASSEALALRGHAGETPPARDLRVAVDRLFMIPFERAIEGAPRVSRAGAPRRNDPDAART